jgi:nitroimidazol reductase NimA-like FMN-containing flavoprotein (pyridoxamine 5'-phosphate oxidase superfamily)
MENTTNDAQYVITYDQLVDDVCWRLLARSSFGRVVFCQDGEPGALPVNSAVSDETIVFRTSVDTTLFELSHGSRVAFEADHTDHIAESGWSVLVRGTLHEVTDAAEIETLASLPVHPWAPGNRDRWMRIVPDSVTGRTISRHRAEADGTRLPYMPPG